MRPSPPGPAARKEAALRSRRSAASSCTAIARSRPARPAPPEKTWRRWSRRWFRSLPSWHLQPPPRPMPVMLRFVHLGIGAVESRGDPAQTATVKGDTLDDGICGTPSFQAESADRVERKPRDQPFAVAVEPDLGHPAVIGADLGNLTS